MASSLLAGPKIPLAPAVPETLRIHNQVLVDNWAWLRNANDPRLEKVFKNEADYAQMQLKSSRKLAKQIYKEFLRSAAVDYKSHPYTRDGYKYYFRQARKQAYPVHYRIKDQAGALEELILDENKLARGKDFFALGALSISYDGRWMAYSVDSTGDENYELFIKDLLSGNTRSTGIKGLSDCIWKADSETLLLTRVNERFQTDSVWSFDTRSGMQKLIFRESDPAWDLSLYLNCTRELVFLSSSSKNSTEARYMSIAGSTDTWTLLLARSEGHIYSPDYYAGKFYIQSNFEDPDYAVYTAEMQDTETSAWKTLVPPRAGNPISTFQLNKQAILILARQNGFERLEIWDRQGAGLISVLKQEEIMNLDFWDNPDPEADHFFYTRDSELQPYSIYRYQFIDHSESLEYQAKTPEGIKLEEYQTELLMVPSTDGASIPLRLIYSKKLDRSRPQAALLYGYGAYGDYEDPYFSSTIFPLLDSGLIYAVANIRGGGEFGKKWYDEGRLLKKKNSFTDFIACIDYLLDHGISSEAKLAIQGGSAGGLLIGSVVNLVHDRVKVAVLDVPFVDPVNTMLDPSLPLTIQEYEEWGNPAVPEVFDYILSYSPYDNITAAKYPTMLISSALNDSRVGYWEGLKYAQKLRSLNQSKDPIIFRLLNEGHTGSTNRFASLKEYAETMAFILHELGL